jgi:hypothetical protein
MAVVMSPAAQAATPTHLTAKEGSTSLTSAILTAEAATQHGFTVNSGKYSCPVVTIGEATVSTPATSIEVHPEYKLSATVKCKGASLNATITTTGCNYKFTLTETKEAGEAIKAGVAIVCSGTNKITATTAGSNCVVTIGSQSLTEDVVLDNQGASPTKDILMTANLNGIKYTETGTNCIKNGVESTNGKYEGSTTGKGFKDLEGKEGAQVDILVD